jgi:membrane fusion protein, multidrug efflux system
MTTSGVWRGRSVAWFAIIAAIALGFVTAYVLERRPRTNDAHLFAYSVGLASEVTGRVIALHVTNDQRVTKDQPLLEIDPDPFELRRRQAQAQVAALKAQIALTSRQVKSQMSGADAAAAQINRAEAKLALARDTLKRLEPLLAKGYATNQQVDEARTNERDATVALTAVTQQANQARQAVGDTDSLAAQLAGAEAAEAITERDLRKATLRAPFDGTIVGLQIAEGAFASAGSPLFTLIQSRRWYAIADFQETELAHMAVGDRATVWVMGHDDRPIDGQVESLGSGVQPQDGNGSGGPGLPVFGRTLNWVVVAQRFPVWIRLQDPPEEMLRIGATASVRVRHGAIR